MEYNFYSTALYKIKNPVKLVRKEEMRKEGGNLDGARKSLFHLPSKCREAIKFIGGFKMKLKYYKNWGIVVLLLFLIVVVAACGSKDDQGSSGGNSDPGVTNTKQQSEPAQKEPEPIEFSYNNITRMINWKNDLLWVDELYKRTNAKVKIVDGGEGAQYYSNVDLRVGSRDFPDSGVVRLAQANVYGEQGAFLDLKPLIDQYAPSIKKFIEENPDFKSIITTTEGKIFGLVSEYPRIATVLFYRKDMATEAGITSDPRTIEQFTEMLRKLKDKYAKDNRNYYPYTGRGGFLDFPEVFLAADGIENGKVYGMYASGRGYDIYSPGFKEMVTYYKQLYDEKLIDPEWVAGTITEDAWEEKMTTGMGSVSYDFFTRPSLFMAAGPERTPGYDIQVAPYLLDVNGKQSVKGTSPRFITDRAFVINSSAQDKAPGIIKFLDYLFSEEGMLLSGWGVEGESYREVGGKKEFILDFSVEVPKPLGEKRWSFLNDRLTYPLPINNEAFYQWNTELTKKFASELFTDKYTKTSPVLVYTTELLAERTNLVGNVRPLVDAEVIKFINGSRSLTEWDAFLDQMEKAGYKEITKIDQSAYDAMQ